MHFTARMLVSCCLTSALILCLSACGGSSLPPTKSYAVTDTGNHRVLIYSAPLSANQSASIVLGQANFTNGSAARIAANNFSSPTGIATDSSGNLYVADYEGCRVLQFKPPFTSNMNASAAIGEPDFTDAACSNNVDAIENANGVAIDNSGNLWVTDTAHIVEFVPPFSTAMPASLEIGQTGFGSGDFCNQSLGAPTASTVCSPQGITFDAGGNLWIADYMNNRVLEYKPPFSNSMAATLELGQPSATAFTSATANNGGISASTLYRPEYLAFDASGNLWVADQYNQRILKYAPPFSNGMAASVELGQPSATAFTSNSQGATQSEFSYPTGVSFDSSGNMQITDPGNSRVMVFAPPFTSGMNATIVVGQTNFTSGLINQGGSVGANTLSSPYDMIAF